MQQALYRKYRPGKFTDLVGQEPIKLTLANQVKTERVGHAYIFAGPKGTGKTTVARILAKAVNCPNQKDGDPCGTCGLCTAADEGTMLDLIEIDGASHTGVDNIRELINNVNIAPSMGRYKVYVIDEAHMLSKGAFNALLKTLEEPPAQTIFILATTEIDRFPATIVSRCQRFDFRPIKQSEMCEYLRTIADAENIAITNDALTFIVQQSEGGMRDALSLLERSMSLGVEVTAANLSEWFGLVGWERLMEMTERVVQGDRKGILDLIESAYVQGYDLPKIAGAWTKHVRQLLAAKVGNVADLGLVEESAARLTAVADKLTLNQILWWLEAMLDLSWKVKSAVVPQLPLEVVAIRAIEHLVSANPSVTPEENTDQDGEGGSSAQDDGGKTKTSMPTEETAGAPLQMEDKSWGEVVAMVQRKSPTLGAVLQSARWRQEGTEIVVSLTSKFYQEKLEQPASREMVHLAISECGLVASGVELKVRYVLDEGHLKDRAQVDPGLVSEIFG